MRGTLHLNAWMVVVAQHLPRTWRSGRTNRILALADKSVKRTEEYLDVRRIVNSQIDIEQLLRALMTEQRLWLFK
jgi:hypothetical protein